MLLRKFLVLCLLLSAGCTWGPPAAMGDPAGNTSGSGKSEIVEFAGTVVHVSLEGGFYGIVADGAGKYDPVNLPESYRQDGLKVRVRARSLPGAVGFHMWGTRIEILDIQKR